METCSKCRTLLTLSKTPVVIPTTTSAWNDVPSSARPLSITPHEIGRNQGDV